LHICAVDISQMKTVIICATGQSISIWRTTYIESIIYSLVLENFTQLCLHCLIKIDRIDWLFRVTDIPNLDTQIVSWNNIFPLFTEISWTVAGEKISEEVLLPRMLVFKISSRAIWSRWCPHITKFKSTLISSIYQKTISSGMHLTKGNIFLNVLNFWISYQISYYIRFLVLLIAPKIGMNFITW
jgi:hypothetical protein